MPLSERTAPVEVDATPDDRFGRFGLSRQESRVLTLAMSGRIDKQIAVEMGISLGTVRVYWKRIRQKTGGTRSETIASLARRDLKTDFDLVQDRTDELERELEKREHIERRARLFEAAFTAIRIPCAVLKGTTGEVLLANPALALLLGGGDVVGRLISEWTHLPWGDCEVSESNGSKLAIGPSGGLSLVLCGARASIFVAWSEMGPTLL